MEGYNEERDLDYDEFNTFGGSKSKPNSNYSKQKTGQRRRVPKQPVKPMLDNDVLQMLALQAKALENLIR